MNYEQYFNYLRQDDYIFRGSVEKNAFSAKITLLLMKIQFRVLMSYYKSSRRKKIVFYT